MKRFLYCLVISLLAPITLSAMSLDATAATNAPIKYRETYFTGLVMFENQTKNTNYDYLAVSLPLMVKEQLKKVTDFFITRGDVLLEKEDLDPTKNNHSLKMKGRVTFFPSLLEGGKTFKSMTDEEYKKKAKRAAGLRKKLLFRSEVIVPNDETYAEIAKSHKCHYLIYGDYSFKSSKKILVRIFIYNAMRAITIKKYQQVFDENRVLLDLDSFMARIRRDIIQHPTGSLQIVTDPPGVMVYFNDRFMGRTPYLLSSVAATNHVVYLRKEGFKPLRLSVAIGPGKSYRLKRKMYLKRASGTLAVTSDPPGATVYADLIKLGKTPLTLTNMQAGIYRLVLEKDGYHRRMKKITVNADKKLSLSLNMRPVIKGELTTNERSENFRKWMNVFFWSSGGALLTYAFLYFNYQDNWHAYLNGDVSAWQTANNYKRASDVALGVTLGCLGVSAYFLVRYLLVEDKELGYAPQYSPQPNFFAGVGTQQIFLNWRF